MEFSSPLDVGSRLTSGFGQRWNTLHAGTDYGPVVPGRSGAVIRTPTSGKVLRVGRGNGRANASGMPYHSGLYAVVDLGMIGGDRMRLYSGHMLAYDVRPGELLDPGQPIGWMGGSGANGANDFAVHAHLGVSQNHDRPVRAATRLGAPGWINFDVWMRGKGIIVGTTPPLTGSSAPVTSTPEREGVPDSAHVRSTQSIRDICTWAGHGTRENSLGLLIERYQHRQHAPYQLVADRVWGQRTEDHYQWTKDLQNAMNRWKGYSIGVDGDYREKTVARVLDLQIRNQHGTYKGYRLDGVAGPVFCRMLGISAHP